MPDTVQTEEIAVPQPEATVNNENNPKGDNLTPAIITLGLVTLLVLIILVILFLLPASVKKSIPVLNQFSSKPEKTEVTFPPTINIPASPTPTIIPLRRGPAEYGVSSASDPTFVKLKLSEFSPNIGEKQDIFLDLKDNSGQINSVTARIRTDNKSRTLSMKLNSVQISMVNGLQAGLMMIHIIIITIFCL